MEKLMSRDEIISAVKALTVEELVALTKVLQETFGVTANRPITVHEDVTPEPVVEVATSFNVVLMDAGNRKINVIKTVREVTGFGLKESKDIVDTAPKTIKGNVSQSEADALKVQFETEGATISIQPYVD